LKFFSVLYLIIITSARCDGAIISYSIDEFRIFLDHYLKLQWGETTLEVRRRYPEKTSIATVETAVWSTGEFFYRDSDPASALSPELQFHPTYYVALHEGVSHVGMAPDGKMYKMHDRHDYASTPPGPIQWDHCPWPVLPVIGKWLEDAGDLVVTRSADTSVEIYTASSESLRMEIIFSPPARLLELRRGSPGSKKYETVRYEYPPGSKSDASLGTPDGTPTMIRFAGEFAADNGIRRIEMNYRVVSLKTSADGSPEPARFDPQAWGVQYVDEDSNVYDDQGRIVRNLKEDERAFITEFAGGEDPWMLQKKVAVGAVVAVALAFFWKRARGGE
jgi:hypothetical protein